MLNLIITPTYNESKNLSIFVKKINQFLPNPNLLIIDDNSPDGTGEIADELSKKYPWVKVIHRHGKLGLGTAYQTGFKWALEQGFDFICTMDTDLSHDPEYLPAFLEKLADTLTGTGKSAKGYDIAIGSRYIPGGGVAGWSLRRKFLSYWGNFYARTVTRLPLKDCTSGFIGFRRKALENIGLDKINSEGYGFLIELKYRSFKKGYKICEIPIVFVDRIAGKSKISRRIILEAIILVWRLRFKK